MKLPSRILFAAATLVAASSAHAATATKTGTVGSTDLTAASTTAWSGGSGANGSPTSADVATWDSSSLGAGLTVGSAVSWGSINITGAMTNIGITGAGTITTGNITLAGTQTLSIANAITLSGNSVYTIDNVNGTTATDATLSGAISGAFGITKEGGGTLVLSNTANTFSSAIVNAGTLEYNCNVNSFALPNTTVNALGTLALRTTSTIVDNTNYVNTGTHTLSGAGIINKVGAGYLGLFGGNVSTSGFTGQLNVLEGVLGTNGGLSLGGARVAVATGTAFDLRVGNSTFGELSGGGRIGRTFTGTSTLSVGALNTDSTFSGVIENTLTPTGFTLTNITAGGILTLTKTGTGTLTLSGVNTYTGATSVTGGTILVNGSLAAGTATTVSAGARLGGSGTVNGTVNVATNGTIRGGTGAATGEALAINGNVTLASGSIVELVLGAGGTHSTLNFNGATDTLSSSLVFNFLSLGATTGDYAGIITGVPGVNTSGWTFAMVGPAPSLRMAATST